MMRTLMMAGLSALALAACETTGVTGTATAPETAEAALEAYYATIPDSALPTMPDGPALPAEDAVLTRILFGSCNDEELAAPALSMAASMPGDLMIMLGDNVYGDKDGRAYAVNDPDLTELRESFADLARQEAFTQARAAMPILATWDDHDYGANDAGANFPFRSFAERIHEVFFQVPDDVRARPGVYDSYMFGPEGSRTQIILLDTRYFRSELTPTDEWGTKGKERYIPNEGGEQVMLGEAQWDWLEAELQKPADLRLVASSIQVLPTAHGWEAWDNLPDERQRLFDLIRDTEANGVVFLSGDRHTSFLYRDSEALPYPAYEITSSSLNLSFQETSDEVDPRQLGAGFALVNFGEIAIDWNAGTVALNLRGEDGTVARSVTAPFGEIGVR